MACYEESALNHRELVIVSAIRNDAAFVGDYFSSLRRSEFKDFGSIVNLCMANYLSLFVYEGFARLSEMRSPLALSLSPAAKSVVTRSRHSLKFFEDTKRGLTGQLAYFDAEIISAHKEEFFGNTWLRFARRWEADLGLFRYSGKVIGTTHSATFALGVDPQTMFQEGFGPALRDIWAEFGQYFGALGAAMNSTHESFFDSVDPKRFGGIDDDVRSQKFYSRGFTGDRYPGLNALLTVFMSCMNFIDLILPESSNYSLFKIRYLTTYQVLRSLEILKNDSSFTLDSKSKFVISSILDNQCAQLITTPLAKPFRNTLMHYGPDTRLDVARLDENNLIESLIPLCFDGVLLNELQTVLEAILEHTSTMLNFWSR